MKKGRGVILESGKKSLYHISSITIAWSLTTGALQVNFYVKFMMCEEHQGRGLGQLITCMKVSKLKMKF